MFKSNISRGVPDPEGKGVYRMTRAFGKKRKTKPLRRFDCFDPENEEEIPTQEDLFLNEISQKVCLLSLQVSRIENRLSAFETQPNDDLRKQYELRDPPNCPPTVPIRRKKIVKKNNQSISKKTANITDQPMKK